MLSIEHLTDVDLASEQALEQPLAMRIYNFVSFDRIIDDWCPSARLLVESFDDGVPHSFWQGVDKEVEEHKKRAAAKLRQAARLRARQAAGEARRAGRPQAAGPSRPVQRPHRFHAGADEHARDLDIGLPDVDDLMAALHENEDTQDHNDDEDEPHIGAQADQVWASVLCDSENGGDEDEDDGVIDFPCGFPDEAVPLFIHESCMYCS